LGSAASGGSWDKSSEQAKNLRNGRRFCVTWSEDLSHEPPDAALPKAVVNGTEPFLIIGAIAGG